MLNYEQVRQHLKEHPHRGSPARGSKILIVGFAVIILAGTLLLMLPIATEDSRGLSWDVALFTAVSATTVTGLAVVGTESTFSLFGEIVILALIQVGGIGFITLSVILFRLIGRRVSIFERNLLRQTLGFEGTSSIVRLTLVVLATTVVIELVGAIFLFSQWIQIMSWQSALYYSIFHSISAFCNAGFDLFHGFGDPVLIYTKTNAVILITLSILITVGTLGITVIYDIVVWPRDRHISLHTKLIIPLTVALTVIGTLLVILDEFYVEGHAMIDVSPVSSFLLAFFTVVSSRTAGITLVPMNALGQGSQMIIFMWMFIGGAPASMGGGVGITTIAVVLITVRSTARGYREVRVLGRTLPMETITKAVAVLTVSTGLIVVITFCLVFIEKTNLFYIAFETVSAFSNTGYSLGITSDLGLASRLLIAFTMFWGRLGPLTLVVALAQRRRQTLIHYPEERIIIG